MINLDFSTVAIGGFQAFLEENETLFGAAWDGISAVFTESSFMIISFVMDIIAVISEESTITELTAITTLTSDDSFWTDTVISYDSVLMIISEVTTDLEIQANLVNFAIVSLSSITLTDVIVDLKASFDASQQLFFAYFELNGFDDTDATNQFLMASALTQIGFGLIFLALI
jgi:hypothetical protein